MLFGIGVTSENSHVVRNTALNHFDLTILFSFGRKQEGQEDGQKEQASGPHNAHDGFLGKL